jgi:dephospho-CoA kinase
MLIDLGGIGSGKSTVSKTLNQDFKLPLIDCDVLARRVVEVGKPAYNQIIKEFGTEILDPTTQAIDRKVLGEIVFKNEPLRKKLTRITGFHIMIEILKDLYNEIRKGHTIIVLDAPLLFESVYLPYLCYPTLVVYTTEVNLQIKRIIDRDHITIEEAERKIKSQMPLGKKLQLADIKISNDDDIPALKNKILNELGKFIL